MNKDKKLSKAEFTELMKRNEEAKKARKEIESQSKDRFNYESQFGSYYTNKRNGTW